MLECCVVEGDEAKEDSDEAEGEEAAEYEPFRFALDGDP